MIDILGIVAGLLFAYSGVPIALECIRTKDASHISKQLIWCIEIGAILMLIYITVKLGFDWLVCTQYTITMVVWAVVLFYRYFGIGGSKDENV